MGFWLHKSIKVLPGVHVTLSNGGVSYSVGSRNARLTRHPGGRISSTVGLARMGLVHSTTLREARANRPAPPPAPSPPAPSPVPSPPWPADPPAPVLPPWERDLLDALRTGRYADVARTHGRADPVLRLLAAALDGLDERDPQRARELLAWVVSQSTSALRTHPFTVRHLADRTWPVEIARGAVAHLGITTDVVLLAVAELHQAAGDLDTAIWTVEQAEPTVPAALSLTELYSDAGRHAEVIETTGATTNLDDASALLLVFRGRAFGALGYPDAAREALDAALRVPGRASSVRHRALLERAQVGLAHGDRDGARRDLEQVRAEDPTHPGLAQVELW